MSILDIFKQTPAQPATPAPAAQPNPAPATSPGTAKVTDVVPSTAPVQSPGTAPNGVVPDTVNTSQSPLDSFKDMWETDPNVKTPGEYVPEKLDVAKLQEVMQKVDMSSVITPENLAAITAGGEGAAEAFVKSLNSVSQQTLVQAALVANKMNETSVTKAMEAVMAKLPSMLKDHALTNSLKDDNPIYSHKAVAPIMEAVKSQLATKYPDATTAELTEMAKNFVKATGEAFNPAPTPNQQHSESVDWSKWADLQ